MVETPHGHSTESDSKVESQRRREKEAILDMFGSQMSQLMAERYKKFGITKEYLEERMEARRKFFGHPDVWKLYGAQFLTPIGALLGGATLAALASYGLPPLLGKSLLSAGEFFGIAGVSTLLSGIFTHKFVFQNFKEQHRIVAGALKEVDTRVALLKD